MGQQKIEQAKVQTYWETGRLIKEHLLANQDRAGYGERVIERLAEDLEIDVTVLKKTRRFYEAFPKGAARHLLTWAHYRAIRLKGVDAPEIDTPEGRASKKFVEHTLEGVDFLTIKTTRPDKYGRYLGDVFVPKDPKGVYLNNLLLEKGFAVRVRE